METFKIRASAAGQIMTKKWGKTCENYCKMWVKEQIYNRKKRIESKYMQKGNEVEDFSIDFIAEYLDLGFLLKNEEHFTDEFFTGTPDVILNELIIDAKNSWDFSTFPLLDKVAPNIDYVFQAQIYMHLTGRKKYKLIYTLMDTPLHLIEKDAYYWCKNNGYDELDSDVYKRFVKENTYADIPDNHKIKIFDIDYDAEIIEAIQNRVKECRIYINEITKEL